MDDVDAIREFIAKDSPQYAEIFVKGVFGAVERVGKFPSSGRIVPEFGNAKVREIFFGSYRIIYRVKAKEVEILTVYHGARLLA